MKKNDFPPVVQRDEEESNKWDPFGEFISEEVPQERNGLLFSEENSTNLNEEWHPGPIQG